MSDWEELLVSSPDPSDEPEPEEKKACEMHDGHFLGFLESFPWDQPHMLVRKVKHVARLMIDYNWKLSYGCWAATELSFKNSRSNITTEHPHWAWFNALGTGLERIKTDRFMALPPAEQYREWIIQLDAVLEALYPFESHLLEKCADLATCKAEDFTRSLTTVAKLLRTLESGLSDIQACECALQLHKIRTLDKNSSDFALVKGYQKNRTWNRPLLKEHCIKLSQK